MNSNKEDCRIEKDRIDLIRDIIKESNVPDRIKRMNRVEFLEWLNDSYQ